MFSFCPDFGSHLLIAKCRSLEPKEALTCCFSHGLKSRDHTADVAVGMLVLVFVVCCCCNKLLQITYLLSYSSGGCATQPEQDLMSAILWVLNIS